MRHLKEEYSIRIIMGERLIITNVLYPSLINSYIANRNRRKSIKTLPPFSLVYEANLFIIWHDYSLLQSIPFETFGIQSC